MRTQLPTRILQDLEGYVHAKGFTEQERARLMEAVKRLYEKSIYDPEEPIGVVTAQSLSEPATQMTMRTYHFAGTAGIQVTLGLPRLLEIFDARKAPRTPTMTVYMLKDHQNMDKMKKIAENIKEIKVKDVVVSTLMDLTDMWIKCKLDLGKLKEYDIDPAKLEKAVKIRNTKVSVENGEATLTPKKSDVKNLHKLKYMFLEAHIKGIKGVSQVVVTKENDEWVINTLGSNLKKVLEIEGVDTARTTCNNMFEVYEVLGIEAAREVIIRQAQNTIEEQGLGIDVRYLMLLADLMTVQGEIRAIGRYGISGQKASVLVRASFEETKKHLTNAAIKGERDDLNGVIENIMINQVAPIGTGAFELIGWIPDAEEAEKKKKKE